MSTIIESYAEPQERYRGEFDLPDPPKESTGCWAWCCPRKPKHQRQPTRIQSIAKQIIVQEQKEQT